MRIITRYILVQFLLMSFVGLFFFTLCLCLADLLMNLSRLLANGIPFAHILWLTVLYIPQSVSYALSPSLLFGVAFVLGSAYAHNELITVFSSGIPLMRLCLPLFIVGLLASLFLFFWNDRGVIPSQKLKNTLTRQAMGLSELNNTNVALLTEQGRVVVSADFYNDTAKTLTGVILVYRDDLGEVKKRLDADTGLWKDKSWTFRQVRSYVFKPDGTIEYQKLDTWSDPSLTEPPKSFQKKTIEMNELSFAEAGNYVESLKRSGLPYLEQETDYLQRLSFSLGPFVVIWISAAVGGRYRKNVLLMSLLTSLMVSSAYIILQMVFGLLAKNGTIWPWMGASFGVLSGALAGGILFLKART